MRVALAQINTTVGDVWANVEKAADALKRAKDAGAELVALPELTIPGYPPEDLLMRPTFIKENLHALEGFAEEVPEGVVAMIGFVDLEADLYNACAVVSGGEVLHRYHKHYLPNYGVFDENRYFREGAGAPILRLDGALVGVSVCEDIWYPGGPAREQALGGASVLLNISASPYHRRKGAFRERMLAVRASDYGCYVLLCNLVGGQDELVFDGHSVVFDPEGRLIARAKQFEEDLLLVDLYPEEALIQRLHESRPRKESPERPPRLVDVPGYEEKVGPAQSREPRVYPRKQGQHPTRLPPLRQVPGERQQGQTTPPPPRRARPAGRATHTPPRAGATGATPPCLCPTKQRSKGPCPTQGRQRPRPGKAGAGARQTGISGQGGRPPPSSPPLPPQKLEAAWLPLQKREEHGRGRKSPRPSSGSRAPPWGRALPASPSTARAPPLRPSLAKGSSPLRSGCPRAPRPPGTGALPGLPQGHGDSVL